MCEFLSAYEDAFGVAAVIVGLLAGLAALTKFSSLFERGYRWYVRRVFSDLRKSAAGALRGSQKDRIPQMLATSEVVLNNIVRRMERRRSFWRGHSLTDAAFHSQIRRVLDLPPRELFSDGLLKGELIDRSWTEVKPAVDKFVKDAALLNPLFAAGVAVALTLAAALQIAAVAPFC